MKETEIFAKVIAEDDPLLRTKLVDRLCSSDPVLKQRIERLINAYEQPQTYFDDPLADDEWLAPTSGGSLVRGVQPGSMIGPYKLLQQIGEGGMGLVFMAEQTEPVRRRVAIKIIKPGMDSRQVIARFEAERQALAMMDHPHIAKVLDAGTNESGHPFFVMELVNGMAINEYCDQENMSTGERLRLFIDVCRAVQHAHQKGIIHRDLKPSNILVAEYDGNPVAKVIDFGVAKATASQLTDKTVFTEFGQIIGTVEYMSPEQARRNQLDIDTRSDIYSLGMVLYNLLTGETPFGHERFQKAAWDEMLKIIREEPPPLPSLKIGTSQSLEQIARHRSVEPSRLTSLVRGDLDWIVLKSLEKDRGRRYPSAGEFADDIARHLAQHPVTARPPSSLDRFFKFAQRNRTSMFVTTAALLVLITLGCWLAYAMTQESREVAARTQRIGEAIHDANVAMAIAESATIGDESAWGSAQAQCQRIEDLLAEGTVSTETENRAAATIENVRFKSSERQIAIQIEEVVIQGATQPTLESWELMEREMRELFRRNGFDLDQTPPAEIGARIRDHRSAVLWTDLLELWIAARGQISGLGGTRATFETMQPWADAIYLADSDPIRTGIRKFIYTPSRKRETLDQFAAGVDLETQSPRTLSWLGTCYSMVDDRQQCDRVFEVGLRLYPRDLMLTHDYGYFLVEQGRDQEAVRMFHRCLAIRDDVAGIWQGLSESLERLGEHDAATAARIRANELLEASGSKPLSGSQPIEETDTSQDVNRAVGE